MKEQLTRRQVLRAGAGAVMGAFLAACGNENSTPTASAPYPTGSAEAQNGTPTAVRAATGTPDALTGINPATIAAGATENATLKATGTAMARGVLTPNVDATSTMQAYSAEGTRIAGGTPATATGTSTETAATATPRSAATATEAPKATVETAANPSFVIDAPKSLNPDNGDMNNEVLGKQPKGKWFHPANPAKGSRPKENWSYGVALADMTGDNAVMSTHGNLGEIVIQTADNADVEDIRVGIMTTKSFDVKQPDGSFKAKEVINDYKMSDDGTLHLDEPVTAWIRTMPGLTIEVIDPDTGKQYSGGKDGKGKQLTSAANTANDRGDAAVVMPDNGRALLVFKQIGNKRPVARFETLIWFGPFDKPNFDTNLVDVRGIADKAALPSRR